MDALDLLEKIVNVVDAHIANVNFSTAAAAVSICADELELFAVCLQRLVVVCCALSLRLYNLGVLDADRLHMRFNSIRTGVYNDSTSAAVRNETLSYFTYIVPVDTTGRYTDALLAFLKAVLRHSDDYSLSALNSAIVAVQPLLKQHFSAACKVICATRCIITASRSHFQAVPRTMARWYPPSFVPSYSILRSFCRWAWSPSCSFC